jgi:hypothetical protein
VVDKHDWPKPAAWAITQNERLWAGFDAIADRSVIIEWSLADNYRTHMMEQGDRVVFWITGPNVDWRETASCWVSATRLVASGRTVTGSATIPHTPVTSRLPGKSGSLLPRTL